MRYPRLVASLLTVVTLTVVTGCDKARANDLAALAAADSARRTDSLLIADHPNILYQVFGERDSPRLLPVAAIKDGNLVPLTLSEDGWRRFDAQYNKPGTQYTIYQDGREAGWARITKSMWDGDREPLYKLPGCAVATPLAAADVKAPPPVGYMVELLASDAKFVTNKPHTRSGAYESISKARAVVTTVADAAGISRSTLDALDFRAMAITTGATSDPTLVVSLVDPSQGGEQSTQATHLFVLADRTGKTYMPSYSRIVRGSSASTQYRRLVDHLDLNGDGVDELLLEGWSSGRESYLLVLSFKDGRWEETYKGRSSWCIRAQ
ncbi:MAG TPA: hypothetical protein VHQ45_13530 [Gemmatimonadaceae bacterium]|jgi:hypothetical protein|nr:hypothetical protein [Gemmatimonadaceae bacterium]